MSGAQAMLAGDYRTLGAHWDGEGVNFALFSAHAEGVELCLFDSSGQAEVARHELPEQTHDIWHGYLPGLAPGAVYGYRVHGPYDPHAGHRFNHHKLLMDPYARQLIGPFNWDEAHFGYIRGDATEDLSFDTRDNATHTYKCVVTTPLATRFGAPARPDIPLRQTILYETHVRGFTLRHPELPEIDRGKFSGLAQPQIIAYLKALGITSVELLPVHAFVDEHFLFEKGLHNYWGYNTAAFFAPHTAYLSGGDAAEFRRMVDVFHDAGLEVILDVVYNHTCESNHLGPTLSFRGIDNASYYRLQSEQRRYYINDTGCGNTLNIGHPRVLQLVMDSLRYWSGDMGVDGFRFDLAAVLGREARGFNTRSSFLTAIGQDPQLSQVKLIAEPWDIGPGGYQLGNFPAGWSEWNDDYRDTVRRFWRREPGQLPTLARRLHGSSDLFEDHGRRPQASINFITSHDGYTLRDLVSYGERHNLANGEHNRDGHRDNISENFGVEGPTDDSAVATARRRQQRNLLLTLLVSQGVPMLQAGDELGRTQLGNNNAYCQDNELNWIDWQAADLGDASLFRFVAQLIALREQFPILAHASYIHPPHLPHCEDIQWLNNDGQEMREEHWQEHRNFLFAYLLHSAEVDQTRDSLLVIFNNSTREQAFKLPEGEWNGLLDTAQENGLTPAHALENHSSIQIKERSARILSSHKQTSSIEV